MNRSEIIKAIAEAGASFEDADELLKFLPAFYAFEKIVAAKERERCAKECEELSVVFLSIAPGSGTAMYDHNSDGAIQCAEAIRALGGE